MSAERLQKLLASAGVASRRGAEELIRDGRVRVDGVVAELGQRADPSTQAITFDGRPLATPHTHQTLMLHKPEVVLVTRHDDRGRTTVYDLLDAPRPDLRYVGRLDRDTSGLLLMTTDGQLQHRVTHPRFGVDKVYVATLDTLPSDAALKRLARGVVLSDGPTSPAAVEVQPPRDGRPRVSVTLHEGRNRQVRRMFEAIGHRVARLQRTAIGPIRLGGLRRGASRELRPEEMRRLRGAVALDD